MCSQILLTRRPVIELVAKSLVKGTVEDTTTKINPHKHIRLLTRHREYTYIAIQTVQLYSIVNKIYNCSYVHTFFSLYLSLSLSLSLSLFLFTYPVLFMLGIFPDRDICDAHSWLRLPPNRNEDRELLKLDVRELRFKGVIIGTSISALTG